MAKIKKVYRKKNKKKKNPIGVLFLIFLLPVFCLFFLIIFFLVSPYYQLKEIEIKGDYINSDNSVKNLIKEKSEINFLVSSNSLLFFPQKKIENLILQKFPHFEKIEIIKKFPNSMTVNLFERKEKVVWCVDFDEQKKCYDIDGLAIAFRERGFEPDIFYIHHQYPQEVKLGKPVFSELEFNFILSLVDYLRKDFNFELSSISVLHRNRISVKINNDFEIYFNLQDKLSNQLKRLKLLIDEEIEDINNINYIDLRHQSQVYYK